MQNQRNFDPCVKLNLVKLQTITFFLAFQNIKLYENECFFGYIVISYNSIFQSIMSYQFCKKSFL